MDAELYLWTGAVFGGAGTIWAGLLAERTFHMSHLARWTKAALLAVYAVGGTVCAACFVVALAMLSL